MLRTVANIITTELKSSFVDKLFKDDVLKFYIRYFDDTLALIKESDIDTVLDKLNTSHSSFIINPLSANPTKS